MITKTADAGLTLSGQQVNAVRSFEEFTCYERAAQLTGKEAVVLGMETMGVQRNPFFRDQFTNRAREHAARGGIIAITWHPRNPIEWCRAGEYYSCSLGTMDQADFDRVVTPGTSADQMWMADVDELAGLLTQLTEAGMAPVFRPWHEMSGRWFWWGQKTPESFAALWRRPHDRLTNHDGLRDLVWAWSPDKESEGAERYYPIDREPDFVGADLYAADSDGPMSETAEGNVRPLHPSGLFAFTEVGLLPSNEIFEKIAPSWFLLWTNEFIDRHLSREPCERCNETSDVSRIYALDRVVTMDELRWPSGAPIVDTTDLPPRPPRLCPQGDRR
nr:glycosyl hydrolase [Parvularcula dongshanensis]